MDVVHRAVHTHVALCHSKQHGSANCHESSKWLQSFASGLPRSRMVIA
jgi:hypothetical protein